MNTKHFLFIVLFSLFIHQAQSQKCQEWEQWLQTLKTEYPNLGTTRSLIPRRTLENMVANLYSDKYYVSFFDKSFLNLSEKIKTKGLQKIQKCYAKNDYKNNPFMSWVFQNVVKNYYRINENNPLFSKIKAINTLRAELDDATIHIKNNTASYNELQKYRLAANAKYAALFPSERASLIKIIDAYEKNAADNELGSIINNLNQLPNKRSSLNTLLGFERTNRTVLLKSSKGKQAEVKIQIEKKTKEVLSFLMLQEKQRIQKIELTANNVKLINTSIKKFNKLYQTFKQYPEVNSINTLLFEKKTAIVTNMSSTIVLSIMAAKKLEDLEKIKSIFLTDLTKGSAVHTVLQKQILAKENNIKIKKKKVAEEALAKNRAAQKVFSIEEKKRKETISKHKYQVKKLRQELRIEYGSNLPKIEKLHLMLQYYLTLVHKNKKYKPSDAEAFIKIVENTGYMRIRQNNISDVETFSNRARFRIVASSLVGRPLASVRLEIPKASKKMIELYSKELISEFRNIKKTTMSPSVMPTDSDEFIVSGGTKYSLKINDKGTLVIRARENRELTLPILVDKIQADTWKVNSLKTVTDLYVNKGQEVTLSASGRVKVGDFIGYVTPPGTSGYSIYNVDKRYKHGCLMARIGNGSWNYIGNSATFIAKKSGVLYLKINDKLPDNNVGSFTVKYTVK